MFKIDRETHRIDSIFIMLLFFLFALTAFVLIMIGVRQYKATANAMDYNYEIRTVTSYLREKTRQNSSNSSISIETIDGTNALCLKNTLNNTIYNTYIYYYDGSLREMYIQEGTPFTLNLGQQIVTISGFDMDKTDDGLIIVTISDSFGGTTDMYLSANSN
ncbi:MAG: DUF4860 domain-containing protein [Agathobacter sp.]|uniref:DUF4860 domain-containing protein n=1 Tax=Agathobacter sp. TaxID=2021311 RepID=UPI002E7736B5|nr:DUF4860 domain-containing protein [Agathobacter sp.]MEE1215937.1 DUF4860 domain-containing protein [Agathobacter sp.]